jgi:hypothetical protein
MKDEFLIMKEECHKKDMVIAELRNIIMELKPSYPLPAHLLSGDGVNVNVGMLDQSHAHHHTHPHPHTHPHLQMHQTAEHTSMLRIFVDYFSPTLFMKFFAKMIFSLYFMTLLISSFSD